MGEDAAEELARVLEELGVRIAKRAVELSTHAGRKTVKDSDVQFLLLNDTLATVVDGPKSDNRGIWGRALHTRVPPLPFLHLRAIPVSGERGRSLAVSDRIALLEPEAADPTAPGEATLDQFVIARDFHRLRLRGWLRGWSLCLLRLQPLDQRVQGVDLAVKDIGLCAEGRELVL